MKSTLILAVGALALSAAACTQNTETPAAEAPAETTTIVEKQVPSAPVIVEKEVPVPVAPPIVIDGDNRESTTVRAGRDGLEVETTRRP